MPLAASVVPSMGSTATSHSGPSPSPTSTTPRMPTVEISTRIALTATPSAPFLSPRPTQRPAAMAAASVTRTSSRARLRSGEEGATDKESGMWLSDMAVIVASTTVGRMGHMSQTSSAGGGRYTRSTGGLVGAMLVTVVAVVAFWGLNALKTDHETTPTPAVDYTAMMRAGRADHKLLVMAPTSLPRGWKATSATYQTGTTPIW